MEIQNQKLRKDETQWLLTLLKKQFSKREEIIRQINNAKIEREYTKFFLSVRFSVDKKIEPINIRTRVPVEMHVYRKKGCPVQFLLHIVNGYVSELEVFCADSSEIDANLELDKAEKIEIIVEN